MKKIIFSRLFFCDKCYSGNRPYLTSECLIYRTDECQYSFVKLKNYEEILKPITKGFTPHIVVVQQQNPFGIEYEMTCGICGVRITSKTTEGYAFEFSKSSLHFIETKNWPTLFNARIA